MTPLPDRISNLHPAFPQKYSLKVIQGEYINTAQMETHHFTIIIAIQWPLVPDMWNSEGGGASTLLNFPSLERIVCRFPLLGNGHATVRSEVNNNETMKKKPRRVAAGNGRKPIVTVVQASILTTNNKYAVQALP
jgi:hypothetical protein